MTSQSPPDPGFPPPPEGFATWLDYAVDQFDTRSAQLHYMFDDVHSDVPRDAYRDMVQKEFLRLKARGRLKSIHFVRHGQSHSNVGGLTMAHHAIPLTTVGHAQARTLAKLLPPSPTGIWASPFQRTLDTAAPYCALADQSVQVLDLLHEFEMIDPSLIEGMTGAERRPIAERYWDDADPDRRMGVHAETFREFEHRVETFRAERLSELMDGSVVFGHGMWTALLFWKLLGFRATDTQGMKAFRRFQLGFPMPNGAVYRITELALDRWEIAAEQAVMRHVTALETA